MFGIESGNECFSASDAGNTYMKHGRKDNCNEMGGDLLDWSMRVYRIGRTEEMVTFMNLFATPALISQIA